jgi:hypothetical protein
MDFPSLENAIVLFEGANDVTNNVLALDQVLGDPWSSLTYFGTLTTCRRQSAR